MRRIAEVHRYELACRLIEAVHDVPRPPIDPTFLLEHLDAQCPGQAAKWLAAADAACEYIAECVQQANTTH